MFRYATIFAPLLLIGCSVMRTEPVSTDLRTPAPTSELRDWSPPAPASAREPLAPARSSDAARDFFGDLAAGAGAPALPHAPRGMRGGFTVKGGYYNVSGDEFDDGFIVNLAWTQSFTQFFATEFEIGYLEADGNDGFGGTDLWALPFMINGRFNVPVWRLDLYGGIGFGSIYYDVESTGRVFSASADGWVFAGNGFVGASIDLGDRFALGLEGKYYLSEDIGYSDVNLEAYTVMVTFGIRM